MEVMAEEKNDKMISFRSEFPDERSYAEPMRRIRKDLYQLRPALLLLIFYSVIAQLVFHTVCPFAILTGFPCPACGMTRAVFLFLSGEFTLSFSLHPLMLPWLLFLLYLGYYRYIGNRQAPFVWQLTIFLCLATFGCYLFRLSAGTLPKVPDSEVLHLALSHFANGVLNNYKYI